MIELLKALAETALRGEDTVLASICLQSGSTPRSAGASMVVRRDGSIVGTIGGGLVEAQVIRTCQELLERGGHAEMVRHDLDNTGAAQAGMICGGRLDVCIQRVTAGDATRDLFRKAFEAMRAGRKLALLCELDDPPAQRPKRYLLEDGVPAQGLPEPGPRLLLAATTALGEREEPQLFEQDSRRFFVLPLDAPSTAIVVGGGHVGLHAAAMLGAVGFRTVVMDDRSEFANAERFPSASEIIVPEDLESCLDQVVVTADSYIVILTRGHLHDKAVLAQALKTPACYIGMIGSRRKRDATYAALRKEGVSEEALARVHCPIGLKIGAETPEEIGLSIAAEMVQARAERRSNVSGL